MLHPGSEKITPHFNAKQQRLLNTSLKEEKENTIEGRGNDGNEETTKTEMGEGKRDISAMKVPF